jgi:hypothetical protein
MTAAASHDKYAMLAAWLLLMPERHFNASARCEGSALVPAEPEDRDWRATEPLPLWPVPYSVYVSFSDQYAPQYPLDQNRTFSAQILDNPQHSPTCQPHRVGV